MNCNPSKLCLGLGIAGVITAVLGVLTGWVVVPMVVRSKIAELLALRPNSEAWDRWENVPVPIQYRLYLFDVNNPEEILKGHMPNITEKGPYIYKERRVKHIKEINEENSSVTYEQNVYFDFDAEASAPLSDEEVLTVLNVPAMLFAEVVDNLKYIDPIIHLYDSALEKLWPTSNPVFIKAKVKDYIFKGIPITCNQPRTLDNLDVLILCEAFKILHPKTTRLHDFEKDIHSFAFFKYKNTTTDGVYKIDLGIQDITKIGDILSWNNAKSLSIWRGESCNRIVGTDSTIFRPYLEEDNIETLYIYHTDICRSVKLTYKGETEFKGVKGRRYAPDNTFFDSVIKHPDNHCYCPQTVLGVTHYAGCLHSGVTELSGCQGAPIIASYPHFLAADPIYKNIPGLNPDVNKHEIFLDLESHTGYPLRGASRIQINSFLKAIPEVGLMKNLPNVLLPNFWLEETVELTDDLIQLINDQLLNVLLIVDIVKWTMIGLGLTLSVSSGGYYLFKGRKKSQTV